MAVNKRLAKAIGLHEAIIYGELVSRYFYFAERGKLNDDGYFFNTIEDLEEATTLTRHQQPKAIKNLCKLNLLDFRIRGVPAKRYFKINENTNVLWDLIQKSTETSQFAENRKTYNPNNGNQENRKSDGNNTIQNTKQESKSIVGSIRKQVSDSLSFDFEILERQIKACYKKADISMQLDEVLVVFDYFMKKHEGWYNFYHPKLKNETIINII